MPWRRRRSRYVVRRDRPVEFERAVEPIRDRDGRLDVEATLAESRKVLDRLTGRRLMWVVGRRRRARARAVIAPHHADWLAMERTALEEARRREDEA